MIDDELLSLAARLRRPRTVVRAMSRVAAPAAAGCALMWVLALGTLALMRDPGGVALVNGLPAVVGPLPVGVLAWAAVMAVAATAGLTLLLATLVIMTAGSLLTHSVPFLPALRVALRYRRALLALAGLGAAAGAGVTVVLTSVESFWPKVAIAGVAAVVLLPLPLAVPAVVLEGRTAPQAVSRAFELTARGRRCSCSHRRSARRWRRSTGGRRDGRPS